MEHKIIAETATFKIVEGRNPETRKILNNNGEWLYQSGKPYYLNPTKIVMQRLQEQNVDLENYYLRKAQKVVALADEGHIFFKWQPNTSKGK